MKRTRTIICGASAMIAMLVSAVDAAPTIDELDNDGPNPDQPGPNGPFDEGLDELDWGDAPDQPYPTIAASNGASHFIVQGVHLGASIDGEADGQPDSTATGDDVLDGNDDEDGVLFTSALVPGMMAKMEVTASVDGFVDAWIDFDQNGMWGNLASELIYSGPVLAGVNIINYPVPPGAANGHTFARIRFNTVTAGFPPNGLADDGEVEDYLVSIDEQADELVDWGDAPDQPYPTLGGSNGARHLIQPGFHMGNLIDSEPNGQPNLSATGDDIAGLPDEDGVSFAGSLIPGGTATTSISVTQSGFVDAWIDFNKNGTWGAAEQILVSVPVLPGMNSFSFTVPAVAVPGATYARFRLSSNGGLSPVGMAPDGEVEDYRVRIEEDQGGEFDFGDAPDPSYATLLASNGARHLIVPGMFLGGSVDSEPDGQPDPTATGDDTDGNDDEDGVNIYGVVQGQNGTIDIVASVPGRIDAWIDYNQDGTWGGGEQILTSVPVAAGPNQFVFPVPAAAFLGQTFARVRYSTAGGLAPFGPAQDGEVQDHEVKILPEGEVVFDFGDAPDQPYPTLFASNGARHLMGRGPIMGGLIDVEFDGQPHPASLGDDLAGGPDEDGVFFLYPLVSGQMTVVQIVASAPGMVDAWIDFNANGSWADAGDQIMTSVPVVPGPNNLSVMVPAGAFGATYSRFRISAGGGLSPTGAAPDGEVEDHMVHIDEEIKLDLGDAPDPGFPTYIASLGAAHSLDGLFLGPTVDAESDGQPDATATGDDLDGHNDDDGIKFLTPLIGGRSVDIAVMVSAPGILDAWIDVDGDGTWTQADNRIATNLPVNPGDPPLVVTLPAVVSPHLACARFRISHGGTDYHGFTNGGEVEDYMVPIGKNIPANINISTGPLAVNLNWLAEPGATSYSVHSSTVLSAPFPGAWTIETPIPPGVPGLTWSELIGPSMKFYLVVAWP